MRTGEGKTTTNAKGAKEKRKGLNGKANAEVAEDTEVRGGLCTAKSEGGGERGGIDVRGGSKAGPSAMPQDDKFIRGR
jgi:hypothetical protein